MLSERIASRRLGEGIASRGIAKEIAPMLSEGIAWRGLAEGVVARVFAVLFVPGGGFEVRQVFAIVFFALIFFALGARLLARVLGVRFKRSGKCGDTVSGYNLSILRCQVRRVFKAEIIADQDFRSVGASQQQIMAGTKESGCLEKVSARHGNGVHTGRIENQYVPAIGG